MSGFDRQLNRNIVSIKPSGIRRFFDLLEGRKDAISLGVGEPDFATPWHIRDAGVFSLEKAHTKYTPNAGLSALRREISCYMERRFGLSYAWDKEILVTVGGSEAIDLGVRAVINPGDEVIIPEPSFVCYAPIVTLAGGVPVMLPTLAHDRFRLTADGLRAVLTERTRMLIFPFPCNPTGAVMERADIESVAAVLEGTPVAILSDEIYAELSYGLKHCSPASLDSLRERTIVVGGLSKSHAMTGWRMGFVCAHSDYIRQMTKIHQYAIMCAPTTSQYAAIEALKNGDDDIAYMLEEYDRRRCFLLDSFRRIGLSCFTPEGAFYLFPAIPAGLTSEGFCSSLLERENVAVIPGGAFGDSGEGFFRACYAVSHKNLAEAVTRIDRFINSL